MYREDQENRPVAAYPLRPFDAQSAYSKGVSEFEGDPYSESMIDEMLAQDAEWREVPEIVKLTFSAFKKALGSYKGIIKELESALPMKANKVDIKNLLDSKANVKDIRKTIQEVAQDIESRATIEEVKRLVRNESLNTGRGKITIDHEI